MDMDSSHMELLLSEKASCFHNWEKIKKNDCVEKIRLALVWDLFPLA